MDSSSKNFGFRKNYLLKAQSPMIHFQYDMDGACLRATELKPKFDRFLIRKFKKLNTDYEKWKISKDHEALDYQMSLSAGKLCAGNFKDESELNKIFYGNMGDNVKNKKFTVFRDCQLTITCFNPELMKEIDKYIGEFFIVTNFGTMQDKGFGSFIVDGKDCTPQIISECLRDEYCAKKCYCFDNDSAQSALKNIKSVYSLIKSGINLTTKNPEYYSRSLLFDYMHDKIYENGKQVSIGNEKAWLKQNKIAPALGTYKVQNDKQSYYVRALLGIGDHMDFKASYDNPREKITVKIEEDPQNGEEVTLERLPSPILFKIIGNTVYYVGQRINQDVYDKRFSFESEMGEGHLKTPPLELVKEDFIDDFLEYCCERFNGDNSPLSRFAFTRSIKIREVK